MEYSQIRSLWLGLKEFYFFAPKKQVLIFVLMLFEGLSAGIGLLFIIPLLRLIGIDMGVPITSEISDFANNLFEVLSIKRDLPSVLISYVIIISAIASLRFCLSLVSVKVQKGYICYLRNHLYRSLLHCNWQFIVQNKMSDFTHCLSGQVQAVA